MSRAEIYLHLKFTQTFPSKDETPIRDDKQVFCCVLTKISVAILGWSYHQNIKWASLILYGRRTAVWRTQPRRTTETLQWQLESLHEWFRHGSCFVGDLLRTDQRGVLQFQSSRHQRTGPLRQSHHQADNAQKSDKQRIHCLGFVCSVGVLCFCWHFRQGWASSAIYEPPQPRLWMMTTIVNFVTEKWTPQDIIRIVGGPRCRFRIVPNRDLKAVDIPLETRTVAVTGKPMASYALHFLYMFWVVSNCWGCRRSAWQANMTYTVSHWPCYLYIVTLTHSRFRIPWKIRQWLLR